MAIRNNSIHNNPKPEMAQMSFSWGVGKQTVVHHTTENYLAITKNKLFMNVTFLSKLQRHCAQ